MPECAYMKLIIQMNFNVYYSKGIYSSNTITINRVIVIRVILTQLQLE